MPVPEPSPSSLHRFRYGEYVVELSFDPYAESEPQRWVALRKGWRRFGRFLYRVPEWVYLSAIAIATAAASISAYYSELIFMLVATGLATAVGIALARRFQQGLGIFGVACILIGGILFAFFKLTTLLPEVARSYAIPRIMEKGGEVRTFLTPEWDTLNNTLFPLTGRDFAIADIISIRGPLEAFSPRVIEDLSIPNNVVIQITRPQDDSLDWTSHVQAIAPRSPMLLGSWWNDATLQGLTQKSLNCDLLLFDRALTLAQAQLIASPRLRYNTLRLHNMEPDSLVLMCKANEIGKPLGNVYLVDCKLDSKAASAMAAFGPRVILEKRDSVNKGSLTVEELDAIVDADLDVRKIFTSSINHEQAERLARIPRLEMLPAVLADEAAVEHLRASQLETVTVAYANDTIVASLMKYPNLGFVTFGSVEGPIDPLIPLINHPTIHGIYIRTYRGTASEIAKLQSYSRVTVGEREKVSADE